MLNAVIVLDQPYFDSVYGGDVWAALDERVHWCAPPQTAASLQADPTPLQQVEVLFTGWGAPVLDDELLRAMPRLRAVFHAAGSVRPIITPAFWRRGIPITHAAVANAVPVVEFCVSAILLSLKQVWRLSRAMQVHQVFPPKDQVPGAYRSRVGLISLGLIGERVAVELQRFDLEVLAYDPFCTPARAQELQIQLTSLEDIFATCDVVSLHTPLLDDTRGLITGRLLQSMRPNATFINTARGAIVRETEMIEVLQRRPDVTAVLDVTDPEPPVAGSPLYSLGNVVLTPHVAGSHGLECRRLGQCMVEELDRFAAGEPMRYTLSEHKAMLTA